MYKKKSNMPTKKERERRKNSVLMFCFGLLAFVAVFIMFSVFNLLIGGAL